MDRDNRGVRRGRPRVRGGVVSRNEDDLEGWDEISDRQRWAVSRYQARQGRYQRDRIEPTNRDRWAQFQSTEAADEQRQIRRGGNK
jgi:hypothetical protein